MTNKSEIPVSLFVNKIFFPSFKPNIKQLAGKKKMSTEPQTKNQTGISKSPPRETEKPHMGFKEINNIQVHKHHRNKCWGNQIHIVQIEKNK